MMRPSRVFLTLALVLILGQLVAQPGPPPPPDVPVTGIEYLIGLGGLYGLRKLINRSKKTNNK